MSTPLPQPIATAQTRAGIFLVLTLNAGDEHTTAVRALCADLSGLIRTVGSRETDSRLACVMAFGSDAWDRIFGAPRPKELHPFRELRGDKHTAVSTPGDILFHVRAARMDFCFELVMHLMQRLDGAVATADQVDGFGYFDNRSMIGFVDGTENPELTRDAREAVIVDEEDPEFAGGSYVIVQKYLHDMKGWDALPVVQQEKIIGRYKHSNIEMDDAVKPASAHNALTNITDENGKQLQILRANMPFGKPGQGEFGTYFIGYARSPSRTERMLENMFIGNPPGNYDRLLDYSRAVTGSLFFAPSADFLDDVDAD